VRLFRALDWLHRLELVGSSDAAELARLNLTREAADEEIKVIERDRMAGGYDGVVRIAHALPLTVFVAALLELPPVRIIGRRLYRRVAARRKCTYVASPRKVTSAGQGSPRLG
jgi:predicted DCC family thiol-disulfide oxidoreductase YuxK